VLLELGANREGTLSQLRKFHGYAVLRSAWACSSRRRIIGFASLTISSR
jgi:hypothetical protein